MRYLYRLSLTLGVTVFLAGCSDPAAPGPDPSTNFTPASARNSEPNPRLTITFDDAFPGAAVTSDLAGPYSNGTCGAYAVINLPTGDGLFDPDRNYKTSMGSCGPRKITFTLNGSPVRDGSYTTIGGVNSVNTEPAVRRLGFMTSRAATGCDHIRYGYDNAAEGVLVTLTGAGSWTVETTEASVPVCWATTKNSTTKTRLPPMPLRMILTEIP